MNGVDTNVLVYSLDDSEPIKQAQARDLLDQLKTSPPSAVLLWQVVGEAMQNLRRWRDRGHITPTDYDRFIRLIRTLFPLVLPTPGILDRAIDLERRYSLAHWDSMLLGACLEAGVTTLYTEDMDAPRMIDSIQLINPFV